ncbi:MAG: hypothetical protein ABUL48_02510, partial [Pseudorhodoplanes sp.]
MRGFHLERILAGTALALVLTLAGHANAQSNSPAPAAEAANPNAADAVRTVTPAAQGTAFETPRTVAPDTTATAPVAAPAPVAAGPVDPAFADKLREILTARGDRIFSRKGEKAAVEAFYRDRNYAPLWVNNGAPSARPVE